MKKNYKKKAQSNSYKFGLFAEKLAIIILIFKGYKILAHRYKNYLGEIDIIAKKSKMVIFIEVKARNSFYQIEEVLSNNQIERIKNSAQHFINKNAQFDNYGFRYDLIAFNKFFIAKHFKGFFSY